MFWKCFLTELFALVNIRMRRKRVTLSDVTHHLFCWQTTTILFSIWTRLATLKQFFNIYKVPEKKTGVKKILMENNLTSNQVLEDAENQIREACEILQREATRLRQQKAIPSRRHVGKNRALSSLVDCKPPCWRPPFYDKSSNADKRSRLDVSCNVLREVGGDTIRRWSFLYRPRRETLPVYTQLYLHWEINFAKRR